MKLKLALLTMVAMLAAGATAYACRTPVFRYAMMRWETNPYYVFYFHHGEVDPKDQALHDAILKVSGAREGATANLTIVSVDATKADALEQVPKEVVDEWRKTDDGKTPRHLLYTPWGDKLFDQRLDEKALAAMIESPARKKVGQLLHDGNAVVWLLLEGKDAKANDAARKSIETIIADCKSGKLASPPDEMDLPEPGSSEAGDPATPPKPNPADMIRVALLRVPRDDPAEEWLVRTLLLLQREPPADPQADAAAGEAKTEANPDAKAKAEDNAAPAAAKSSSRGDRPLVFAVYGRGRAMPPIAGEHITVENLTDCLEFLAGPCSCMIKDQNPGFDLLMKWDWESTAEAVARADDALRNGGPQAPSPGTAETAPAPANTAQTPHEPTAKTDEPEGDEHAPLLVKRPADPLAETDSFARRQSLQFAIILLVVGAVVFVGGTSLWFIKRAQKG